MQRIDELMLNDLDIILTTPSDVASFFEDYAKGKREMFFILTLNIHGKPISMKIIAIGNHAEVTLDPKAIVRHMAYMNADAVVLLHNHPSGSQEPSKGDWEMFRKIERLCEDLDIHLLDSLILTPKNLVVYSMRKKVLYEVKTQD